MAGRVDAVVFDPERILRGEHFGDFALGDEVGDDAAQCGTIKCGTLWLTMKSHDVFPKFSVALKRSGGDESGRSTGAGPSRRRLW